MTEPRTDNAADSTSGLVFRGPLRLMLTPLSELPDEPMAALINSQNEMLLSAMRAFQERPELEEGDYLANEIRRIDQKLSLVLELVGTLVQFAQKTPEPRMVELDSSSLKLQLTDEELARHEHFRIDVYLDPMVPKPLRLFAMLEATDTTEVARFTFTGVSQGVQDGLDRFLFRQHRRQVAQLSIASPSHDAI